MRALRLPRRRRAPRPGILSPDLPCLAGVVRRTRATRLALACACIGLLAAAGTAAGDLEARPPGLLPSGSGGVVVLDLSLSIAESDYRVARAALRRLVDADAPLGLVVFSDVPYELFPPGTPASALRPVLERLVPPRRGRPPSPWAGTFRAGTRISAALELAGDVLARDKARRPSILLVSDLQTAPEDVPLLVRTVERLRRQGVSLRVVPLSPPSDGRLLFQGLLGKEGLAAPAAAAPGRRPVPQAPEQGRLPVTVLVLGALFLAFLAVHERLTARLALPRPYGKEGA